jgi:hypothetical protein
MRIFLRIIAGIFGLVAGFTVVVGLPLFLMNERPEIESGKLYRGHTPLLGAFGLVVAMLLFTGFCAFLSYILIRYALRGNEPPSPSTDQ